MGEHNIFRLRGADWNDALDMAPERGESVAFTCAYAGNLKDLAGLLRRLAETWKNVELAEEISELITTQRGYQANTRIITVTDSMLEELVNMKR